ncbi:MAG TPA: DUF423 domain-containing protein [Dyella sp.]|uniref:DUF423 domain-containing protein n=1 Tax=Dyella sp. TaxID=1869338 RepID=UPI002B5D8D23|nr:DUF423 domain-containing protein [Dyella sp.]HTV85870.1 DUF423 domain-containing protein [Dyella sp.]
MRQLVHDCDGLLAGTAGASAVVLGAFGAHGLRAVLDASHYELWHTAVEYHFWHALALVLALLCGRARAARVAVFAFGLGIVLFSGSLYALALGANRMVGLITPIGGVAFIVGWIALGWAFKATSRAHQ